MLRNHVISVQNTNVEGVEGWGLRRLGLESKNFTMKIMAGWKVSVGQSTCVAGHGFKDMISSGSKNFVAFYEKVMK
jgi:hypothetical protein